MRPSKSNHHGGLGEVLSRGARPGYTLVSASRGSFARSITIHSFLKCFKRLHSTNDYHDAVSLWGSDQKTAASLTPTLGYRGHAVTRLRPCDEPLTKASSRWQRPRTLRYRHVTNPHAFNLAPAPSAPRHATQTAAARGAQRRRRRVR